MALDTIDFDDEERRVLEYFRPSALGRWYRGAAFDASLIIASLILLFVYIVYGDPGAGFVAYGLVFWRAWSAFRQQRRYAKVYRSIFTKYQGALEQLEQTSASQPRT